METGFISILVQGGAVGLALSLTYVVYQQNKNQTENNKMLNTTLLTIAEGHRKTIERNTDAWVKNTEATITNTQVINQLKERIK